MLEFHYLEIKSVILTVRSVFSYKQGWISHCVLKTLKITLAQLMDHGAVCRPNKAAPNKVHQV